MQKLLSSFLSLILLILGGNAYGIVCTDVLNTNPRLQDTLQMRWDGLRINDQRNLMLMMLGSNGQPHVSRKDIFDKGEMELGLPLGDGRTLILSYQADSRNANTYKLGEINIMDQAAERDKLDGRPLDVNSLRLSDKAVQKIQEALGQGLPERTDILFPAVIEGRLMDMFQKTENWIEQLRPDELATLKIGDRDYRRLHVLGQKRRFMEFVLKMLPKKILWKAVEWGVMFGVITTMSSPAGGPPHIAPIREMNQPAIAMQLAQTAQADISRIIRENTLINPSEKVAIYEAIFRNNSNPARVVDSPVDLDQRTEIRTTNGHDLWILNRDTGRIFLTVMYQQQAGGGVQLVSPVIIEIPQTQAPQTYQAIFQLFRNVGPN